MGKIELAVNADKIELINIKNELLELDGKIHEVILLDGKGEVEINSNLDMIIHLLSHQGSIEINQISATSKIYIPDHYSFQTVKKGIATSIYYEKNGKRVNDYSLEEAENLIEFNGMKSELIIAGGEM